jgi:internalin A
MNSNTPQEALDRINQCKKTKNTTLDLCGLGLTQIPFEIAELTWLTRLWLHSNQLTKIEGLSTLTNLTQFFLHNNQLTKIEGLTTLTNLTTLWLDNNQLTKIEGLSTLTNLTELVLANNQLTKIEGLTTLTNLTSLYLYYNQLIKIEGLTTLTNLTELNLSGNHLTKIEGLITLTNLTELWLSNNHISDLSPLLFLIKKGINVKWSDDYNERENSILIKNNPLEIPDIETVQRGNEAILQYFEEKEAKKEVKKQNRATTHDTPSVKMILFGNSGAGKTNLSKYLRTGLFDEKDRDSTHGILIENWPKPEDENILVHIWDFGGQEYYHGAYRLFMTNKTVFVLLWEQDTNQNFGNKRTLVSDENGVEKYEELVHFELQYWLDNIAHFAPESPIFLVQNKIDAPDNQQKRHLPELFEDYSISDDFAISLKSGSDPSNKKEYRSLQHFKKELIEMLKLRIYKDDKILSRLKIRNLLLDLQEKKFYGNPFSKYKDAVEISVNDFEKIMKTVKVDIQLTNTRDVLGWLHTRGIVLFYKDNPELRDKAFLQPKKIIDFIYGILNKNILEKDGQFSAQDLDNEEIDKETAIALMLQMELIFEVPYQKDEYIAPQYLPETHALQDLYEIASEEIKNSSFSVKLPLFYYRRVMQQLILFYGKNQDAGCLAYFWKHGILIKKDGIRLLIKGLYPNENEQEGIIVIATDKSKDFQKLQKKVFNKIKSIVYDEKEAEEIDPLIEDEDIENINPSKLERITLKNKERHVHINAKQEKMNKRMEVSSDGIHFITYENLLDQAEKNERKILAFDKNKKPKYLITNDFEAMLEKVPARPLKVFISYSHDDMTYRLALQKFLVNLERENLIEIWQDGLINAGDLWSDKIENNLEAADIVILLVSQSFIASSYVYEVEMAKTLKKVTEGTTKIIPVLLSECDWRSWKVLPEGFKTDEPIKVGDYQFLPADDEHQRIKPMEEWQFKDKAWMKLVTRMRAICKV